MRFDVEVRMAKSAAQLRMTSAPAAPEPARIIDIRTRKAWQPAPLPYDHQRYGVFLFDSTIIVGMVCLGAWFFMKMQGG